MQYSCYYTAQELGIVQALLICCDLVITTLTHILQVVLLPVKLPWRIGQSWSHQLLGAQDLIAAK